MKTYARFATVPIGAGLAALDGGLTLTTTVAAADLSRTARSDIGQAAGVHGAEFVFWGDATLLAALGVVTPAANLAGMVGADAAGIGWRLDQGKVYVNNVAVASGIAIPVKGDRVGVRIDFGAGTVGFYLGATLVHSRALAAGTWHFAVSLGSAVAGELACAVNAGQWIPASAAAAAGWAADDAAELELRLADMPWLSATTDTPANARYEGLIDVEGIETYAAMHHWAWGGDAPTQGGNAQVGLLDPDGLLDDAVAAGVRGARVAVQLAPLPEQQWQAAAPNLDQVIVSAFTNGEDGIWIAPRFAETKFQDASRATPWTADGQPVGAIVDKAGHGYACTQPTAGSRPLGYASRMDFDGADDYLSGGDILDLRTGSMFAVTVVTMGAGANQYAIAKADTGGADGRYALGRSSSSSLWAYVDRGSTAQAIKPGVDNSTEMRVLSMIADRTNDLLTLRENGVVVATTSLVDAVDLNTSFPYLLGSYTTAVNRLNGSLHEVVQVMRLPAAGEIEAIEARVAAVHGIVLGA